jgi:2-aminoethylphosphonate-pyruvate transaminase
MTGEIYNFTAGAVKIASDLLTNEQPIPHRSNEFMKLYKNISSKLLLYLNCDDTYSNIILSGSGTTGIECLILNYTVNKNCLYISNGYWGDRCIKIARERGHKENLFSYKKEITENLNYNEIEEIIKSKKIETIIMVHHETSSSILNDLQKMNDICAIYNCDMVVDTVSSIGVIEINLKKLPQISFITFSSGKGLLSFPGLSFIIGKKDNFEECKNYKKNSFYLDINEYYESGKLLQTLTTPAVGIIQTTYKALFTLPKYEKYIALNNYIIQEFEKINIYQLAIKEKFYFGTIFLYPKPTNEEHFFEYLENNRIFILKCKQQLSKKAFQVCNIGEISYKDVDFMIEIINNYFNHF